MVRKKTGADERDRMLRQLSRRRFVRFRFMGCDALVVRIRKGELVSPFIQALLERGPMRIYPIRGGYIYKWPYNEAGGLIEGLEVEGKGWDHEHCDACNRNIEIDGTAWLTVRGSHYTLCPYCYRRVLDLSRPYSMR